MFYRKKETAVVYSQTKLATGIYDCRIKTPAAKAARAGQFIGVYPKDASHLLARPISICEADSENSVLRIVYRVAGEGTKEFSGYQEKDDVKILANLGNGFPVEEATGKTVLIMGGGIGIPPMLGVAKAIKDADKHIFLGYRDVETFLSDEFLPYGSVYIATEDGSVGCKGNVMNALSTTNLKPDMIMACGPMPMLRAIKKYAEENDIVAYISLEERMACGVGACLGCVCKTTHKDHHSHVNNTRICTEGPVFDAREVDI